MNARKGFTLVEMLMVILIISMLIGLLLPAVNAARVRAMEAATKIDVEQLCIGLDVFMVNHHAYPPDRNHGLPTNAPPAAPNGELATALRKLWPRAAWTHQDINVLASLDQAEILVFWLGGIWDGKRMRGFGSDPRNPFAGTDALHDPFMRGVADKGREIPTIQFSDTKLRDHDLDGFPEYYPDSLGSWHGPYVFFASRPGGSYLDANSQVPFYRNSQLAAGIAVPYQMPRQQPNEPPRFAEEGRYQIVCAGIDNDFGDSGAPSPGNRDKFWPTGGVMPLGWGAGDADNIVSFSKGRLGDTAL